MKKFFITFSITILFCSFLFSQTYFSTYSKQLCTYNEKSGHYDDCEKTDLNTLFKMNSAETMFEHTTPSMSSTYYVNDKTYDDSTGLYMYAVTSDVGNKYIFVFDVDKKEIRTLGVNKTTSEPYIITWYIKSMWTDEK